MCSDYVSSSHCVGCAVYTVAVGGALVTIDYALGGHDEAVVGMIHSCCVGAFDVYATGASLG